MIKIDWNEFMRDHCVFGFFAYTLFTKGTADDPVVPGMGPGYRTYVYKFRWRWKELGGAPDVDVPWHRCFERLSGRKRCAY